MRHIDLYEAFNFKSMGTSRLIIVEGTAPYTPEVESLIRDMEETGELTIVDMSSCDVPDIEEAVTSDAMKVLFVGGDDCDRRIRYAVMDLHPEIIPASDLTPSDLLSK